VGQLARPPKVSHSALPLLLDEVFPEGIRRLACGGAHTIFITGTNDLYGFGLNEDGQLAVSDFKDRHQMTPIVLDSLLDTDEYIASVSAGDFSTLFLTSKGKALLAGRDELGNKLKHPKMVFEPSVEYGSAVQADVGTDHYALVTDKGMLFTGGHNGEGKTGIGKTSGTLKKPSPVIFSSTESAQSPFVKHVACGISHTICVDSAGAIWGFGENRYKQVGTLQFSSTSHPLNVSSLCDSVHNRECVDVCAAGTASGALTISGDVFTWGLAPQGALGLTTTSVASEPTMIAEFASQSLDKRIKSVRMAWRHSLFLTEDGRLFTAGDGSFLQLGHGDLMDQWGPKLVDAFTDMRVQQADGGHTFSVAAV
jgi:alpha-tubulin suppressor-like RCC1 family protein